jgi:hypothetical protein
MVNGTPPGLRPPSPNAEPSLRYGAEFGEGKKIVCKDFLLFGVLRVDKIDST